MRLSGSNYGMPDLTIDQALAFHAEVGFRAMELTVLSNYATALAGFDAAEIKRVRELFRHFEIECSGIAHFRTLIEPDPTVMESVMAEHRRAIDLAVDLAPGSTPPVILTTSGGAVADWPAACNRLVDYTGQIAEYARSRGVIVAMKAHAMGCVSRPHHLVYLFEQVGLPSFRFCFDMSHFEVQGLSIEQAMYPLLALSAHTEVKASIGRAPNQEYMIPGEPNTQSDFLGQFKAMVALGYRGFVVPEMSVHVMRRSNYDQYAALRLSYRALTDVLREVGVTSPGS
jgi:sugar phosphate isomerase/epimerase